MVKKDRRERGVTTVGERNSKRMRMKESETVKERGRKVTTLGEGVRDGE